MRSVFFLKRGNIIFPICASSRNLCKYMCTCLYSMLVVSPHFFLTNSLFKKTEVRITQGHSYFKSGAWWYPKTRVGFFVLLKGWLVKSLTVTLESYKTTTDRMPMTQLWMHECWVTGSFPALPALLMPWWEIEDTMTQVDKVSKELSVQHVWCPSAHSALICTGLCKLQCERVVSHPCSLGTL